MQFFEVASKNSSIEQILIKFSGLLVILSCAACAPYSSLQTPYTLPPGEQRARVNYVIPAMFLNDRGVDGGFRKWLAGLSIGMRQGLANNLDFGMRAGLLEGVSTDLKYQFLSGRIAASAGLGASVFTIEETHFGAQPFLLAGNRHIYMGYKSLMYSNIRHKSFWDDRYDGLIVGGFMGDHEKLFIEMALYRDSDGRDNLLIFGIGLELQGKDLRQSRQKSR